MAIPDYILKAADAYCADHGGDPRLRDAFIAGHRATRQPKSKNITLSCEQERLFEQCWLMYGRKGNKALAKKVWANIKESVLPIIPAHIQAYVSSRERRYQKDFERYLRDAEFQTVVSKENSIVFDPGQFDADNDYHPLTDGISQIWDAGRKCLMFNGYLNNLNDGYTDDNRPNGATIAWQLYTWKWSKEQKKWVKQND